MKSRLTLASLAAAVALFAMPTASQAGGADRMGKCLFGWMHHHHVAVKGAVHKKKVVKKAKKVKKAAKAPKK